MTTHAFATNGHDHCPFMPVFGAPAVMFERGSGTELLDRKSTRLNSSHRT